MILTRGQLTLLVSGLALLAGGVVLWITLAGARTLPAPGEVLAAIPRAGESPADQALARLAQRVRQDPRSDNAWVSLGDALMQKSRETMDGGYYARAESAYRTTLELNPRNAVGLTGLAWVYGSRHQFQDSIDFAKKALAIDPQNQAAYGLIGDAEVELGQYDHAFTSYQRMLDIRPDLSSYSRGAHLLYMTGDTRKAIWLMQKAVAAGAPHAENTAWCRAQLALILWNTGALLPAEQTAAEGLERTPGNYHLLVAMAKIKAAGRDYDAAADYYRKAIAVAPLHEAVVGLGDVYAQTGKREEAEKQYTLVQSIHDANRARGVLGDLDLARFFADHDRNLGEALRIAEREFRAGPNVAAADVLAWAYYKNGRYDEARKMIARALARQTPDATFRFHAGMIAYKLGDRTAARQDLYEALSLNPGFHPLYASIAADMLTRLGS